MLRLRPALLVVVPSLAACGLVACGAADDDERLGTADEAITICPTGTTLEGVDVSHYDGTINWAQVKASGRAFAFAKATEGTTYVDSQFSANWTGMKQAGVVRSAYHFFHCDTNPVTQANFFLATMGTLQPGDLPPTLDFEDTTTCSSATGVSLAIQWLDAVAAATGTLPIFYTAPGILNGFANQNALAGHGQLWIANIQVTCPNVPAPFTAWPFWQYSWTGTVPGIPGATAVDLDKFNGTMAALLGLTVGGGGSSSSSSSSSASSTASSASSSSGTPPPTCKVNGVSGTCIDVSVCAAMSGYHSTPGFCPGPVTEECCTPTGSGSSSSSSSSTSASSSSSSTTSSTSSTSGAASSSGAGGTGGTGGTGGVATTASSSSGGTGPSGAGGAVAVTGSSGGVGGAGLSGAGGASLTGGSGGTGAHGLGGNNNASSGCSAAPAGRGTAPLARAWLVALAVAAFARRPARRRRAG